MQKLYKLKAELTTENKSTLRRLYALSKLTNYEAIWITANVRWVKESGIGNFDGRLGVVVLDLPNYILYYDIENNRFQHRSKSYSDKNKYKLNNLLNNTFMLKNIEDDVNLPEFFNALFEKYDLTDEESDQIILKDLLK